MSMSSRMSCAERACMLPLLILLFGLIGVSGFAAVVVDAIAVEIGGEVCETSKWPDVCYSD